MLHSVNLKTILFIMVICLSIVACRGSEPAITNETIVAIESTKPTLTVEPTLTNETPVTSIDQIVGTWMAQADLGDYFLMIYPDGTVKVASTLEKLDRGSTDSWRIWIEKDQILADDYILCGGEIGSYFAVIYDDGTLKFTAINEPCSARMRLMDKSLPGRLTEYNLVYKLVR